MAEWKSIMEKYVTIGKKDHWWCKLCKKEKTGHRGRVIAHLTRIPGKGVEICPKITPEQVEELKRKLGSGSDLTGADGQQPQQTGENDDIRQENGNKKRKGASGSGTSGNNQREAEVSLEATSLQPGCPVQYSSFSELRPACGEDSTATAGTSHDRRRAYVPNTDNGGFQGTNAVGSSGRPNIIHQGQHSSSQGQVDHRNDQHTHPHTSTRRDAFGVEMARFSPDEPQLPCPPGFNPDLWKLYLEIDNGAYTNGPKFPLYETCMLPTDEKDRKALLGFLAFACSEARNYLASDTRNRLTIRWTLRESFIEKRNTYFLGMSLDDLCDQLFHIEKIENKIREETEGVEMLSRKRNDDKNCWEECAERFKSDVVDLKVKAEKAESLEEICGLLSLANVLKNRGDMLIAMGQSLLNLFPKDISFWSPTYMSCGSQFVNQNQMPPTQFPNPTPPSTSLIIHPLFCRRNRQLKSSFIIYL